MQKINNGWLKQIYKAYSRCETFASFNGRSSQSIFIDRYFKYLSNKCYKLKIKDVTYYGMFLRQKNIFQSDDSYSYGIEKLPNCNSGEFKICFMNEKFTPVCLSLKWNDILNIEFAEISTQKYCEIVKLFY